MVNGTMASEQLPTARTDVLLRRVGSEWVLFDARRDRAHVLNLTAAVVWTYCDGHHASAAIAEAIAQGLQETGPDAIRGDIEQVLRRFASEGLLQ
jgi:coenzyme PQQ synthesis protein D (PqqD)